MKRKKVNIIGIAGLPAKYGGFETLVENLVECNEDVEYTVFCSKKLYKTRPNEYKAAQLKYLRMNANGISSILYDLISLISSIRADVILVLGVSGCIFLPIIKVISSCKVITNIDGLEWKRDKWNRVVKCFLLLSERIAVKYSDVVIADNKAIVDYVASKYNIKAELIEYGSDHAEINSQIDFSYRYTFSNDEYAFSVCRIEPENNIHKIIDAFKNNNKYKLVIVGNWFNNSYGKKLYNEAKEYDNIILLSPVYDPYELGYLRTNAKVYIHGHSAGGTNPSLVEAMYSELPIFAYDCIYNKETTENQCCFWKNTAELISLVNSADDIILSRLSKKLKKIANMRYTWKIISKKYYKHFIST